MNFLKIREKMSQLKNREAKILGFKKIKEQNLHFNHSICSVVSNSLKNN